MQTNDETIKTVEYEESIDDVNCQKCDKDSGDLSSEQFALQDEGSAKSNDNGLQNKKLNHMSVEVLVSNAIKMLFFIYKIVMSAIGIVELTKEFGWLNNFTPKDISLGLFICALIFACACFIYSAIIVVYATKCGIHPFPLHNVKTTSRYEKASIYALLLVIFGLVFLALSTPAEWFLIVIKNSVVSSNSYNPWQMARFVGDIVVDVVFIALSVLACVQCRRLAKSSKTIYK